MRAKKPFSNFVQDTIKDLKDFDSNNENSIKEVLRMAIKYYDLKSSEKVSSTASELIEFLYIASMAEENMLSRIAELATDIKEEPILESIYKGHIVRTY